MAQARDTIESGAIPIKEAMKTDPEVAKLVEDLKAGRIYPSTPIGTDAEWTEKDIADLHAVLDDIFKSK